MRHRYLLLATALATGCAEEVDLGLDAVASETQSLTRPCRICSGPSEEADEKLKEWFLGEHDSFGDLLEDKLKDKAKERLQAVGLDLLGNAIPFVGSLIRSGGGGGPDVAALIRRQTEVLLEALDDLDASIRDHIDRTVETEIKANFRGIRLNAADYFRFQFFEEKRIAYPALTELHSDISQIRQLFENDVIEPYDHVHVYADVVALEFSVVTEFVTMTKLLAQSDDSDRAIASAVRSAINARLAEVLEHLNALDWRAKSASMFPPPLAGEDEVWIGPAVSRGRGAPPPFDPNREPREVWRDAQARAVQAGLLDAVTVRPPCTRGRRGSTCVDRKYGVRGTPYRYRLEGQDYELTVWRTQPTGWSRVPFVVHLWVEDAFGELVGYEATRYNVDQAIARLVAAGQQAHVDSGRHLRSVLQRAYVPLRTAVRSWWRLAGRPGEPPRTEWDDFMGL